MHWGLLAPFQDCQSRFSRLFNPHRFKVTGGDVRGYWF